MLNKKIILSSLILSSVMLAQTVNIHNGWQLLGASGDVNMSKFNNTCVDYIWKYDDNNATGTQWKVYIANGKSYDYNGTYISTINNGDGFWVKGNSICDLNITSKDVNSSKIIHIHNDWQLLGATKDINVSKFDNGCVNYLWKYDTTDISNPKWLLHVSDGLSHNYSGGLFSLLKTGEGYWVKGNSNCDINISNPIPGTLNTHFGTNGKISEMYSTKGKAVFNSILINNDDSIIAAGSARDVNKNDILTLYKYLPNGSKDVTFGNNGVATADHIAKLPNGGGHFPAGDENVKDAGLQSDGKIVIAEQAWHGMYEGTYVFGLARFDTNGTLDTTFGNNGFSVGGGVWTAAMAIQNDDKILVVGSNLDTDSYKRGIVISRFDANGTVDTTFGNNGSVFNNQSKGLDSDAGSDIALQQDGKIVVVGSTEVKGCSDDVNGTYSRGLLMRVDSNGSLDTTFGTNGIVHVNASSVFDTEPWDESKSYPCSGNVLKSVKVAQDGKIVVMGTGFNAPYSFFIARFDSNGTLDTTFGYDGVTAIYNSYKYETYEHLNTNFSSDWIDRRAENMKLLSNGKIAVSGHFGIGSWDKPFMVCMFNSDGKLDRDYGVNGFASMDTNYPNDVLYHGASAPAIAEQSNGNLLIGGYAAGMDNPSHALMFNLIGFTKPSYIINDNFDNDTIGTLPKGWTIKYNGTGNANQKVVDTLSASPTHSFQLEGQGGWAANIYNTPVSIPDNVTVEANINIEKVVTNYSGWFALYNKDVGRWGTQVGGLQFKDGNFYAYYAGGNYYEISSFTPHQWYHVKITYNRKAKTYQIYIDGALVSGTYDGKSYTTFPMHPTVKPTELMLTAGNGGTVKVYYDDVKMY